MSLARELQDFGLFIRGVTRITPAERDTYAFPAAAEYVALVGNIGSSYWAEFSESPEYADAGPDPLDRWSRRVAATVARDRALTPIYPFDGPPYYPFQQWAHRAEGLEQSPIGVMMHPEFGLWHSYRFALLGAEFEVAADLDPVSSPCRDCVDQPCLKTCPVDAFSEAGYAVDRCAQFLQTTPAAPCNQQGCLARVACPVAPRLRYLPAQGKFHLKAFLAAH